MRNPLAELGAKFLVGGDEKSIALLKELKCAAATPDPVLIVGETGTGKELVARELHHHSARRNAELHTCNCADLTRETATSELFGHERGAFTGADQKTRGLFPRASRATLFLDELGELPSEIQAKLLRAIQQGEVRPVGSTSVERVEVRVIAATNRRLDEALADGTFRRDLKERFRFLLHLPPLRSRRDDIPPLVDHFIHAHRGRPGYNSNATGVAPAALDRLCAYHWPGNVRELENAVMRALATTSDTGVELLGMELFPDRASTGREALDALVNRVQVEQELLADAIIDSIIAGRGAAASPTDLAKQYRQSSLRYQLAFRFKKRFPGSAAKENVERVFAVTTVEAINRLLRVEDEPYG